MTTNKLQIGWLVTASPGLSYVLNTTTQLHLSQYSKVEPILRRASYSHSGYVVTETNPEDVVVMGHLDSETFKWETVGLARNWEETIDTSRMVTHDFWKVSNKRVLPDVLDALVNNIPTLTTAEFVWCSYYLFRLVSDNYTPKIDISIYNIPATDDYVIENNGCWYTKEYPMGVYYPDYLVAYDGEPVSSDTFISLSITEFTATTSLERRDTLMRWCMDYYYKLLVATKPTDL